MILAGSATVSQAQQAPSGTMPHRQGQSMGDQSNPSRAASPGMMGPGMMGPGMMTMMMIMVDTNGDGALSIEEVQAVHTRMFNYADADKDGKLTPEELRGFMHGGGPGSGN
tara:strand:+ start:500 stop:832 length:333 start_codon:yes stop_codon:yes gene_type:complete